MTHITTCLFGLLLIPFTCFSQSPAKEYHDDLMLLVNQLKPYETGLLKRLENFQTDSLQACYDLYNNKAQSTWEEIGQMESWQSDAALRDQALDYYRVAVSFAKDEFKQAIALIAAGEGYKPKKNEMTREILANETLPSYKKKILAKLDLFESGAQSFLKKYAPELTQPDWMPDCGNFNNLILAMEKKYEGSVDNSQLTVDGYQVYDILQPQMTCQPCSLYVKESERYQEFFLFESSNSGETGQHYNQLLNIADGCIPNSWIRLNLDSENQLYKKSEDFWIQISLVKSGDVYKIQIKSLIR